MSKRTAIVFDMDGLMVDSEPLSRQAWDEFLRPYGVRIDDDLQSRIIGWRADVSTPVILAQFGLEHLDVAEVIAGRRAIYEKIRAGGVPKMPGLRELLARIAERGLPWAVATSSPRRHAWEVLAQLGLQNEVAAVACGDEVAHGKPAPDIYLLAAERLGVPPEQCLAMDDSGPGTEAAVAAGMLTIAIPNGHTTATDFSHADYVYDSLYDVVENLDGLLRP
ncbi:MAG TPA: HAD family phosphatase [Anaerolineae bacterium]|nr:HAD family phosphatase [Anaerolineae bacterium]HIP71251.1 HAD family phosphatase [Anaerolineae bacterium]